MQIRAAVLNDLARHIPADYYSSRVISSKLTIFESENFDRIRNQTRIDFHLAKELIEQNDRSPTFTPREVSATEVLNAVAYYLMFYTLEEDLRTPRRLDRMRTAEAKLNDVLNLYIHHLDDVGARLIVSALAASNASARATTESEALPFINPVDENNNQIAHESTGTIQDEKPLNFDLLATRDQLLTAFGTWGLKPSWFKDLKSHPWLLDARRMKGQGQRGNVVEPLFCPLAVMNGLVTIVRRKPRMSLDKGWDILELRFPDVSHAHSVADPREQTGYFLKRTG